MHPIPPILRRILAELPRMKRCALAGKGFGECFGRIEWHHVWIYAGRQIQEIWAILGGCEGHHAMVQKSQKARAAFERESMLMATEADLAKYPRKNWNQIKRSLL